MQCPSGSTFHRSNRPHQKGPTTCTASIPTLCVPALSVAACPCHRRPAMTIWGCPTPPRASSTPAPPQILGRPHTLLTLAPRQAVMLSRHACRKQATLCRAGAVVGRQLGVCHLGSAVLHARARAELMIDQVGSAPSHLAATEALACRWWCVAEPVCHAHRPDCCAMHWTGASTGAD